MARILVVDDEQRMRHLLCLMLKRAGHEVAEAGDGVAALERLADGVFDMVISDIKMPEMDGMTLLSEIQDRGIACPVVFITAFATVDSAVEAMRTGAVDYITKPFEEERILLTVQRTEKMARLLTENRDLKRRLRKAEGGDEIVFASAVMRDILDLLARVAVSESVVLIMGESGTGKELLARRIHDLSPRARGRFVPVNCAAISPNLVESELFGHEKGAFTGADRKKEGKFEYASGGTMFLDEIGDLPLEAQAKLLRALQERKIQRVGGNEEVPVDVRFICATNRDLKTRVTDGDFRPDLYYRVNVFPLTPPPLRDRVEDIIPLAEHFLRRNGVLDPALLKPSAREALMRYGWPGNVRELANAVERALILAGSGGAMTVETFSFLLPSGGGAVGTGDFRLPPGGVDLESLENDLVRQALDMSGGNQTAAARLLGLTRAKFRVFMKQVEG